MDILVSNKQGCLQSVLSPKPSVAHATESPVSALSSIILSPQKLSPLEIPKEFKGPAVPLELSNLFANKAFSTVLGGHQSFSKEELRASENSALQQLLQYATDYEVEAIVKAQTSPRMADMCHMIKLGKWEVLLQSYGDDKDTGFVLLAAFCRQLINVDELATAMMMVRAYAHAPEAVKIVSADKALPSMFQLEGVLDVGQSPQSKLALTKKRINTVPKNQQWVTLVKLSAFDEKSLKVINAITAQKFMGATKCKFDGEVYFAVLSAGLARKFFELVKVQWVPMLHLVPDRRGMAIHLLEGRDPLAVPLPGLKTKIHGASDDLTLCTGHDYYHASKRAAHSYWAKAAQQFSVFIEDLVIPNASANLQQRCIRERKIPPHNILWKELLIHTVLGQVCEKLVDCEFTVIFDAIRLTTIKGVVVETIEDFKKDATVHFPDAIPLFKNLSDEVITQHLLPAFKAFEGQRPGFLLENQEALW